MRSGSVMVCAFAAEQIARPISKANGLCIFFPFLKGERAAASPSRQPVASRTCLVDTTRTGDENGGHLWGTDLAEDDRMALLEYLKNYARRETGASDVGREPEHLGKSAVEFRRTCRAQTRQLQQGLEYLWDLNPADVSTVAGMQPGGEVQVMVVGPIGPKFLRRIQHAWVEHGRP